MRCSSPVRVGRAASSASRPGGVGVAAADRELGEDRVREQLRDRLAPVSISAQRRPLGLVPRRRRAAAATPIVTLM